MPSGPGVPQELTVWCSGPGTLHRIRSWQKQEAEKVDQEEGGELGVEEEGGVVPFLNSRDPRLAGGKKRATCRIINIPL